jgi:hypothetical protein
MQAASDEEVFDFIDRELGSPEPKATDLGDPRTGEAR